MLNVFLDKSNLVIVYRTITTLIVFLVISIVSTKSIGVFFSSLKKKSRLAGYNQRIDTLRGLLQNGISTAIFFVMTIMIVKDLGFDIAPLLTTAGIAGLALSFGAQTLVKDVIAGFFIILENQFNVGDIVKIGDFKGRVRRIDLRTTVLKDERENLILIPNSEIKSMVVFKKQENG